MTTLPGPGKAQSADSAGSASFPSSCGTKIPGHRRARGSDTEDVKGFSGEEGVGSREERQRKHMVLRTEPAWPPGGLARCTGAVGSERSVRGKERRPPAGRLCPRGPVHPAATRLQAWPERFLHICSG